MFVVHCIYNVYTVHVVYISVFLSDNTYIEVLDSTRVHPETYEWARKMAVDALEYDEVSCTGTPLAYSHCTCACSSSCTCTTCICTLYTCTLTCTLVSMHSTACIHVSVFRLVMRVTPVLQWRIFSSPQTSSEILIWMPLARSWRDRLAPLPTPPTPLHAYCIYMYMYTYTYMYNVHVYTCTCTCI